MTATEIRALYSEACHGAGAEARWIARDRLEATASTSGHHRLGLFFDEYGLNLMNYFASRPISRG